MSNKVFRGSSDFNYAPPLKAKLSWRKRLGMLLIAVSMVSVLVVGILHVARNSAQERTQAEADRKLQWVTAERLWYDAGCRVKSFVGGYSRNYAEYREVWHCPDGTVHLGRATDDK